MTPKKPIVYPAGDNWRDVPDYEGHYQVNDQGQVWSLKRRRLLNPFLRRSRGGRLYRAIELKGTVDRTWTVHQIVASAFLGWTPSSGLVIDHINNDPLDNRASNLRLCTGAQNLYNEKRRSDSTTLYKGVGRQGDKWKARIRINGKRIHLGTFDTPEQAYLAYCEAAREHFGEFARLE